MSTPDHHTEYLARAVAALTPQGHDRVDELLDQLTDVVGDREELARFANARRTEADAGAADASTGPGPLRLTRHEIDELATGFTTIRDQEPLDDVADWANAVLALLEDEEPPTRGPRGPAGR